MLSTGSALLGQSDPEPVRHHEPLLCCTKRSFDPVKSKLMDLKWPLEESVEKLMLMRPWTRVPTSLSDPQFESVSDALLDESAPHSSTETTSDIEQDTEKETQFWKQYYRVFCLGRSLAEHPVFQADSDRVNPADLRPLVSRVIRNLDCAVMRYLVANDGRVEAAFDAIVSTLHWRRKYQPDRIPYQHVWDEANTGKMYINGFDKQGRPIIYLRNYRHQTGEEGKHYGRQIKHLIFVVEQCLRLLQRNQAQCENGSPPYQLVLLFDMQQYSVTTAPPMHVSKYFLHLFSAHYPERLGQVYVLRPPWYFHVFYKLMRPFIADQTQRKFKFISYPSQFKQELLSDIDAEQLEGEFGGSRWFHYEHETYWQCLLDDAKNQME